MSERDKWENLLKEIKSTLAVSDKDKRAKEFLVKNLRREITKHFPKQ